MYMPSIPYGERRKLRRSLGSRSVRRAETKTKKEKKLREWAKKGVIRPAHPRILLAKKIRETREQHA